MDRIGLDRWLRRAAVLVAACWLFMPAGAQAQPRVQTQGARTVPLNEDPDDPTLSREERIRRAREGIARQVQARQQQIAEERKRAAEAAKAGSTAGEPPSPPTDRPRVGTRAIRGTGAQPGAGPKEAAPPPPPEKPAPKLDMSKMGEKHVSLYMTPAAQSLMVGERFATDWRMLNLNSLPVTSVVIAMAYPPEVLKPVAVHQDALKPLLKSEPKFEADEAAGRMVYRAEFKQPYASSELKLLTIDWQALAPAQQAHIQARVNGAATDAFSTTASLTQTMIGAPNAVNGATVQVLAAEKEIPGGLRFVTPSLHDLQPILAGFPDQTRLRAPSLWINQPSEGRLATGQWMVVDIGVDNPDHMVFDELKLALKFDPDAIEVADTDENNSIHRGVNILDGPFKKTWFWTVQFQNTVDNIRGTILYHVGIENMSEQPSGTIARIFVRAKKPAAMPVLSWIWDPGDARRMSTGVFLMGDNVYLRGARKELAGSPAPRVRDARRMLDPAGADKPDPALYRFGATNE